MSGNAPAAGLVSLDLETLWRRVFHVAPFVLVGTREPLLACVNPGRFARMADTLSFPFPADVSR